MTVGKDAQQVLIAVPKDLLAVVDAAAKARRQSRTSFVVETLADRLIREGILDYTATVRRILDHSSDAVVSLLSPEIVPLALVIALALSAPAAEAQQASQTYAEKHPVICYVPVHTIKAIKWIGKHTHTEWLGSVAKKTGTAASDAVVSFGNVTEKYHPAMQSAGYGSQILYPLWVRLAPR